MGAKIQAFDIFQTPLSSHYPLPLNLKNRKSAFFLIQFSRRWSALLHWGGLICVGMSDIVQAKYPSPHIVMYKIADKLTQIQKVR